MSDKLLKVGRKGEIFTDKELRERAKIREGGKVRAIFESGRLIIEPVPSLEDLISSPVMEITVEEAERMSEEAQREEGVHG